MIVSDPDQLSSSMDPRGCVFCQRVFPEFKLFKVYVCEDDAQQYLVPLEKAAAAGR